MICTVCGREMPEGSRCCPNCGSMRTTDSANVPAQSNNWFSAPGDLGNTPSAPSAPRAPMPRPQPNADPQYVPRDTLKSSPYPPASPVPPRPPRYIDPAPRDNVYPTGGGVDASSGMIACPNCGSAIPQNSRFCAACGKPIDLKKPAPSSKKKVRLIAAIVAAVIALTAVAGIFVYNALGLNGPMYKIYSASRATLSAESFTARISVHGDNDLESEITVKAAIDPEQRDLTVLIQSDYSYSGDSTIAIYDGYLIIARGKNAYKQNIREQIDVFFDSLEQNDLDDFDFEDALRRADPSGELYEELCEEFDLDEAEICLKEYAKKLNSKSWLEDHAGLEVKKEDGETIYRFDLNGRTVPDFLQSSLEFFEPAFLSEKTYRETQEEISDIDMDIDVIVSFAVDGKYLTSASFELSEGRRSNRIDVEFSDMDSTHIDENQLQNWLDNAQSNGDYIIY